MTEQALRPDWRKIAADLYAALGTVLDRDPVLTTTTAEQAAIDAYEYATDAEP